MGTFYAVYIYMRRIPEFAEFKTIFVQNDIKTHKYV